MSSAEKILYLSCHNSSSCRSKLAGVLRYAQFRRWRVEVLDVREAGCSPARAMEVWNCRGMIVDAIREEVEPRAEDFKDVPCVFLDCGPIPPLNGAPVVTHDSVATTAAALAELERADVRAFAYVCWPTPERSWARARQDAFVATLRARNLPCFLYAGEGGLLQQAALQSGLMRWLRDLPARTGIFAANDEIAARVLSACDAIGRVVPDELVVVGVDNDETICTNASPQLSSVEVDFEHAGYLAAEALDALLSGHAVQTQPATFGPLGVIRRESTRRPGQASARISKAVRLIREHACEGLSASDVVNAVGGSRRSVEIAFREVTGHTIQEEMRRVRFERLCALLRKPDVKIDVAARQCGYGSVESLRALFRKHMGMSMREWREHEYLKTKPHNEKETRQ